MSAIANFLQILVVLLIATVVVLAGWAVVGEDPFKRQAVVWIANVAMLLAIWGGLRRRRQTWKDIGLGFRFGGKKAAVRAVLQSLGVAVFALVAFVIGSMVTAGLGSPERADMSGYEYLQGNLPMLLLALAAVYIVSSLGEEVVYRGFLMTRLAEIGRGTKAAWWMAVVVSGVVFGLAHFEWGIVGIIQTGFMGVALAVSYLVVKRNLWVLVLAHAYIDTALLLQLYLGAGDK